MKRGAVVFLVVLALAGASVADVRWPEHRLRPREVAVSVPGGLLACPIGTAGSNGAVSLANLGDRTSSVRVTWIPAKGGPVENDLTMPAGSTQFVVAPRVARARPASVTIEFSGSDIVASHEVFTPSGMGGEACQPPGGSTIVVDGLSTRRARSTLAVMNPGGADADVTISLIANGRTLTPVRLSRRVIAARSRLDLDMTEFAFGAGRIVAIIKATSGRVLAEGLVERSTGAVLVGSVEPSSQTVLIVPKAQTSGGGVVIVGDEQAALDARTISGNSQGHAAGIPGLLAPSKPIPVPFAAHPGALYLEATAGSPLVGSVRWSIGPNGATDEESIAGMTPGRRWGGLVT
ncbi:MAG: DUF5719 family protein, partial [Actinobacteria bacterium]|nr:DUF5719 family protein [Actinomycetota bacterium]